MLPRCLVALLLTLLCASWEASAAPRRVMTWVPPYAMAKCQARLEKTYQGAGPGTALTDLALQFWKPTAQGGVVRESAYDPITDEQIGALATWAHAHGIRIELCIYNGGGKWDWALAKAAFGEHRSSFVSALMNEVNRLGLDGVDVDFEGDDDYDADRPAFVQFIQDLATALHAGGKQLTVDSFPTIWNAPNVNWWPDLLPLVDGLTSMGYNDIGRAAKGWRRYSVQKASAGENAAKLMLGVPSDSGAWRGSTAQAQVNWIVGDGSVGVAIWDAQFPAPAWRNPQIWRQLAKLRSP